MQILSDILGFLGGVSVVITGLIAYLGKTRLEAHKAQLQATNTRLNKLLESATHVTKAQFDKEFKIYQEVWAALVELRIKVLSLRPMLDHVDKDKTEEEIMQERLGNFGKSFTSYRDLVEINKPFYELSIYESLSEILKFCHHEAVDYQFKDGRPWGEYWENQKENHEKISNAIDSTCELIRERINSMSIIE